MDARRASRTLRLLLGALGAGALVTAASAAIVGDLAAGMTNHPTPPDVVASRPAGPSAAEIGAQLKQALLREADQPLKANWRPMLQYMADLHARSILPARAHLPYPYQTMGPGYQDGTVFGHIDLTHERLDTVRALPQHVRNQIYNELAGQQPDGLIPGIVLFKPGDIASWKTFKGFPPIWVIAVDAYVEKTGDTPVLRKCLDALIRQIGWFERQRAVAGGGFFYIDQREGTWESGVDEGVRYDERLTTPAAAVDASAHVFMLYEHAANWSRALGLPAGEWEQKARALQDFIRRELWDPQTGFFYDAWTVREPARRRLAFEGMWPVVVGAATAEQARRVIDEHLLNPREFFTPHPIATVALSDAKFELRMWRGPAWNSMTYWAAHGCARYGRGDAAHRILEAALDGTATQFERTGTIWEFHHPQRGDEESLKRKPTRNVPCRDYVGHNPLFAMADLWRRTLPEASPVGQVDYQRLGVEDRLPVFANAVKQRIDFPLSWTSGRFADFAAWQRQARARVMASLLTPPPTAPWEPVVIDAEDRGSYSARKVVFNLTGDSRVVALMTVPKGAGPFPAVLLLHDHGARFDIGKEKVIRPFAADAVRLKSAEQWSALGYGGRFIGDELAKRGYVCLALDALNWSDRGGGGYDAQASIASNLMHLGMSFAGLVAWEDLRAAEFLSGLPEVDPRRIAAMGWSLGAFRAWQVAALSDHIAAGVAVCWMTGVKGVMSAGNNHTRSASAFTMLHPGLFADLDYADVASLACPKPMLFFNGRQDGLFPVDSVEAAYAKLRAIWDSRQAGDRLVTRLWETGHVFNLEMQEAAFGWLDASMAAPGRQNVAAAVTPSRRRAPDPTRKRKSAPKKKGAAPRPAPAGKPEITWSLMHPVKLDPGYMKDVIAAAAAYQVDSFEICGDVHCNGNLDGAIRFRDYPAVADTVDGRKVEENIQVLREIVALAHASGRPVYYWHREVMVPRAVVEKVPGLLDANGEFNLLGEAYHALVRSKIREFFDHVPDLDGLVLTLTESDYSVIHNSDPQSYPPTQVVQRILETFAAELHARGKRLILRSFGSIAQDYEDILAGAAAAQTVVPFEIETKITPYDFSPFLPTNPYLRRTDRCTLGAEYDSIGEFLGAGYLPAPDPARVLQTVAYARQQGVNRHVIRVDRIGHAAFRSTQAINLFAFERAIQDPATTADDVWRDWARSHWASCPDEMIAVMQRGIEMVKRAHFIDGHVIFHAFPIPPDWKWIKAGGILSTFSPARSLAVHPNMWGILPERTTPSRMALLREKDEAVELAAEGLQAVNALRDRLSPKEYMTAHAAWQRAVVVTRAIRAWCRCIAAYFEDLEQGGRGQPSLGAALAAANAELAPFLPASGAPITPAPACAHEYGDEGPAEDSIEAAYLRPIGAMLGQLTSEFKAEQAERAAWQARPGLVDFVVVGGFLDDIRVDRPMHASHAHLLAGRPVRIVGNRVFPNGAIEVRLRAPAQRPARLIITGNPAAAAQFKLTVQGVAHTAVFSAAGEYGWDLAATVSDGGAVLSAPEGRNEATREIVVRIQKSGLEYPALHGIGIVAR